MLGTSRLQQDIMNTTHRIQLHPHPIHGTGIFTELGHVEGVNVGKCTSPIGHLGSSQKPGALCLESGNSKPSLKKLLDLLYLSHGCNSHNLFVPRINAVLLNLKINAVEHSKTNCIYNITMTSIYVKKQTILWFCMILWTHSTTSHQHLTWPCLTHSQITKGTIRFGGFLGYRYLRLLILESNWRYWSIFQVISISWTKSTNVSS